MTTARTWFADTNIVFHVLRGTGLGRHLISALQFRARQATPMISVVTQAELYSLSVLNGHGADKRDRLEEILNELVIVDINSRPIIDRYAQIDVASHRLGRTIWVRTTCGSQPRRSKRTQCC